MKAVRLSDLKALLARGDFEAWWGELVTERERLAQEQERYQELLSQATLMEFRAELTQKNAIDTLYRAGECEDGAANMLFEATELENRSFRAVSDFEEQRFRVSELWYRLGAAEKTMEELREQHGSHRTKKSETELKLAERHHRAAADEYEREAVRKGRLWDEVERIWSKSAEVGLLVSEQRVRGKRIRKEAESLFALAEQRKQRSRDLRTEADQASRAVGESESRIQVLLEQARTRFGCAPGQDFLYFRNQDNQKAALCISLATDRESFNLEVVPLAIYSVDRQRGVGFLEPAREDSPAGPDGDRRFEAFFLEGRGGRGSSPH